MYFFSQLLHGVELGRSFLFINQSIFHSSKQPFWCFKQYNRILAFVFSKHFYIFIDNLWINRMLKVLFCVSYVVASCKTGYFMFVRIQRSHLTAVFHFYSPQPITLSTILKMTDDNLHPIFCMVMANCEICLIIIASSIVVDL